MKLHVNGIRCGDCVRKIVEVLLKLDLGARVNINPEAHMVRIEGRLSLDEATLAIEQGGFEVATVLDGRIADAAFRTRRTEALAF